MMPSRLALTNLSVVDDVVMRDDGRPFDRVGYSRFKYGWTPPAADYAYEMAERIAADLWVTAHRRPIYIISAPYKFLATASHVIAQELRRELASRAISLGIEPPVLLPFHKSQVGDSSYAKSSQVDREVQLAALGLHLDESLVSNSVVIVVDDIRITGTAENATAKYLEPLAPHAVYYVHAAKLSVEEARRHPGIEDELNQSVSHTLERFVREYEAGEFQLNTRVLRHILEQPREDLERFVRTAPARLITDIIDSAIGTGIDYCKKHALSLHIVQGRIAQRLTPLESVS